MTETGNPVYIIKMRAKPGCIDRLLELATVGMDKSGASDRFTMLRDADDPDVLWNIEVFRSVEDKDRYENSPLADELRGEILDLLDGPPLLRANATLYAATPALPS